MPLWFLITMFIINVMSLTIFAAISKNIQHVIRSHIKIVGKSNEQLIKTTSFFMVRIFYLLTIIFLPIFFFLFLQGY